MNDEYSAWDVCCEGHFEDSQMYDAVTGDRYSFVGATNGDTIRDTDASSEDYSMPYIYASFSWSHCVDDGVDFQAKFDELKLAAADLSLTS